ncbi:MAG: DUF502 domain-containing protein [Chlamydiota bacterium]|nr:DUF502 domain-containing protein [Chlamydiota bacterium]
MKKYFITGLVILLPLALTVSIVIFLINILTSPFLGFVQSILEHYDLLDKDILFLTANQVQYLASKVLILVCLFLFTILLGVIARIFFFHYLIKAWDYIIHQIPFISSVYKTCQDVINTLLQGDSSSFKQVVLVPFPSKESHSVGLVTRDILPGLPHEEGQNLIAVFVPTTPNPTSGYLVMFDEKDITYLDMKVEEALKYIISCGVILNEPLKPVSEEIFDEIRNNRNQRKTKELS